MSVSLFMSVSLSLSSKCTVCVVLLCVLCVSCVCVLCVGLWMWVCGCVGVRFLLSGTEKRSRVQRSKRSRVYVQNAPRHIGHGRFGSTHGIVLNVHTEAVLKLEKGGSLSFSSRVSLSSLLVSLSSHTSPFFSLALSARLSLSLVGSLSLSVLNNNDNDRSSSWLSLYTRPYLALRARVPGPLAHSLSGEHVRIMQSNYCLKTPLQASCHLE